ncbi:endonuclease/exonuclease/phosphatase family protein [Streptomyces sp. NPDC002306]
MIKSFLRPLRLMILGCLLGAGLLLSSNGAVAATTAHSGGPHAHHTHRNFALLQMNVCSSGYAGCYAKTQYPKIVDEVVERVRANHVDAVTLNEACSGDVATIAERTRFHYRFATVIYNGAPLPCKSPEGRGYFGNAVLTKESIRASEDAPYSKFSGVEQRRWICVTTHKLDVCTSHLSTDGEAPGTANSVQCAELTQVLASRGRPTIFAGDVNRHTSCAPAKQWTLSDTAAVQSPGIQHSYGNLAAPTLEIEPTTYTDHDALVVRARIRH